MNCKDIITQLDKYIENELSDKEMKEMKMHLSSCEECSAELKSLQELKKELQSSGSVKAPADFLVRLNERIDKRESRGILKKILFPLKIKLPIEAAGLLATVAIVVLFFLPEKELKEAVPVMRKSAYKITEKEADKPEMRIAEVKSPKAAVKRSADLYVASKAKKEKARPAADSDDEGLVIDQTYELAVVLEKPYRLESEPAVSEEMERDYAAAGSAPANSIAKRKAAAQSAAPEAEEQLAGKMVASAPERKIAESIKSETVSDSIPEREESYKTDSKQSADDSIQNAIKKIKTAAAGVNGVVLSGRIQEKDKNINYIVVEIPAEKNEDFLNRVSGLGKIKQPAGKEKDLKKLNKLRYKIYIRFQ